MNQSVANESASVVECKPVLRDVLSIAAQPASPRFSIDPENAGKGLGQLVLTLVKLLHELLERQAVRRMEHGLLSDEQIEELGSTLMKQSEEIERLASLFDLKPADLNLDLGPIGKLL